MTTVETIPDPPAATSPIKDATVPAPSETTDAPPSQTQSVFPNDTPAQEGPSMGEHCVTDRPAPPGLASTGEITKISDVKVYISKPSDYPAAPSKLLLLLSSGTGIHSLNNQIQADHYATEGFLVVMPDQFGGDPAPNNRAHDITDETDISVIEQVKLRAAETVQSFMLDMWLARQTPEKVMPILKKVIDGVKEEFADAVANGGGIYAVGYCFGGKYVLLLASETPSTATDEEQGTAAEEPLIKAGALAHGTMIDRADFENVKSPVALVCVENDQLFPEEVREAGATKLDDRKITHEIKVYPGVPHGFAVVGEYDEEKIKTSQKDAFEQMLSWLKSY